MPAVFGFGPVLALVSLFLYWRLARATSAPRPVRRTVGVVLLVMWVLAVVGLGSGVVFDPTWARAPGFVGLTWLAALLYLSLGVLLLGFVALVVRVVGAAGRRDVSSTRRTFLRIGSAVVVAATAVTVGYGLVEAATPRVTRTDVALDRLPAEFDGVRVALVSDIHAGPARGAGFVQSVVDEVNAQKPDMIVLDGDLIDGTVELVGDVLDPIRQLSAPLGVFAVSGNHEFYADDGGKWLDLWSGLGVDVLRNDHTIVTRSGADIAVAGVNDFTAPAPYEPDMGAALDGVDPDQFVFMLAHQPRQALEASDRGVDVQVSGHTHAGQLWPIRYLVPLQQPTVEGLDTVGSTTVYTTRGAGAWGPPVRVAAPPEISMLTLLANQSG
ncbi:metallophosphatase [Rhodococcoides trifolii]|uniref:Metallophosphatase n=1 Tax=Rhodococcoides trifolii TaxID=908250 RepID=A0A917LHZ3_9NOCA|nr:metallophosphoesterase [Rhodococcus trifolii]GGG25402.1 metallophosphatase [Rhodococcus trifolii]